MLTKNKKGKTQLELSELFSFFVFYFPAFNFFLSLSHKIPVFYFAFLSFEFSFCLRQLYFLPFALSYFCDLHFFSKPMLFSNDKRLLSQLSDIFGILYT
jgi:hypothetical protein